MKYSIGVDIGGTKISFLLLREKSIVSKKKIATPGGKKEIISAIEKNIKEMISGVPKSDIIGIGIGIPGPLNKKRDKILNPPHLKNLKGLKLGKIIGKDLKMKVILENDVNCFTLAEALMGSGRGADVVLGLTLGTGLGGGIVINGKIFLGAGSAGEFGHMTIERKGKKCKCGVLGCFEVYASESFFKRRGLSSIKEEKKAKAGNKKSKDLYKKFSYNLGIGLANLVNILDPDVIVIGGGFAKAGSLILNPAKKEVKRRVLSLQSKSVKIKLTKLGEFSGAVGAALLVKNI